MSVVVGVVAVSSLCVSLCFFPLNHDCLHVFQCTWACDDRRSLVCWCRDILFLSLYSDVSNLVFYEQSTVMISSCYYSIYTLMRTWSKSGGCGLQKEDREGKEKLCENDRKRLPESGPMWGVCDLNCKHQLAVWTILDSLCACLITKETNLRGHPSCNPGVPYHGLMWLQCCLTLMPNSSWTINRNLSRGV